MEMLKWNNEKMSVGIKLIDAQHQELLKIINQLTTSIEENSQKKDILIIIDELIKFAGYHFLTEEKLFDEFNYEETEVHKNEHKEFSTKFIKMRNKLLEDELYKSKSAVIIAEEVFNYIINWFIHHVTGSDKKYVKLFKEYGIE